MSATCTLQRSGSGEIEEGRSGDMMWRLLRQLYGRRKAGQEFTAWLAETLMSLGFERHSGLPHFFVHRQRMLLLEVHMDDGHGCAEEATAKMFKE